ncbi:3-dehydroquinate synthase [Spongiimicrobium salis]|uniref:3-dehydroquinate synthase n=1 Tax=Spongiimicrobium salis TaxID=1667022 RepID=UPI00374D23D1
MKSFSPIIQNFQVQYQYKLYFTNHLFSLENELFKNLIEEYRAVEAVKMLFVIDAEVNAKHPNLGTEIQSYCSNHKKYIDCTSLLIVEGGEACKNNHGNVDRILQGINEDRIDRHSFVVAIGGGAVIDMVGYAATIAHRGVKLIRIPTTVLSQNDAAVGVKNSINTFGKKNFLGTFATPYAIINDQRFLHTLEDRDWISGVAEAVKVALIKDASFFKYIKENAIALRQREMEPMQYVIYRCAQMHMEHIAKGGDPFESGSSRPLDFGHWAAHKLEHMTNYEVRHGEAVAIGIALDVVYAHHIGLISEESLQEIISVLENIGFDLRIPIDERNDVDELLMGIQEFREHLGGQLTITLISAIGKKHDVHEIDRKQMKEAIHTLNTMASVKSLS